MILSITKHILSSNVKIGLAIVAQNIIYRACGGSSFPFCIRLM